VSDRISLLGVNEAGEEEGIPYEKDGSVVANQVPISLLSVELDCKAARIPGSISAAGLTPHSRETHSKRGRLALL